MNYTPVPGDILVFKKKQGFDPIGSFITSEERDTDVCHVAFVGNPEILTGEPLIWTTGAIEGIRYGYTNAEYLKGRDFYVCRYDNLTPNQMGLIVNAAWKFYLELYGFHKLAILILKSRFGGVVQQLYPWPSGLKIHNPFCSEAVAACFWEAGLQICHYDSEDTVWKKEPSAITPANILTYAQMKNTPLSVIQEVQG